MLIRAGFNIALDCKEETPVVALLSVHPERAGDVIGSDELVSDPPQKMTVYLDRFGNRCHRLVAPKGPSSLSGSVVVRDTGLPDRIDPAARQHDIADLPPQTLAFLIASRYCETDLLMPEAWARFGPVEPSWARVQAIVDFTHAHLEFGYAHARSTRTAAQALAERRGVCRDFAHLAIAFCRCMNIPARYCTGYLGDIGVPRDPAPMDFSAWFEVFLGGAWHAFDARHNRPRIGRIVMARGLDAADAAMLTAFGAHRLTKFEVWTEEIAPPVGAAGSVAVVAEKRAA